MTGARSTSPDGAERATAGGPRGAVDRGVWWIALSALLITPLQAVKIWTADFWWHAALGRYVVETGAIPRVDAFSFTVAGEPIRLVNWLADLILYGAFDLGGATGVVVLKMAWSFGALFVLGLTFRAWGVRTSVACALILALAVVDQPRLSMARPYNLGLLAMTTTLLVSAKWWTKRNDRVLWAFLPLTAVWIPLHGNALLALPMLAGLVGAAVWDRRGARAVGNALAVLACCTALFFVMRDGRDILGYFGMDTDDLLMRYNSEMQPASLAIRKTWIPYAIVAIGVGWCAVDALRTRRTLAAFALAGLGMVTATQMARHAFEASFLAAPAFALALESAAGALERRRLRLAAAALAPATFVAIAGGQLALEPNTAVRTTFGFGVDAMYPFDSWDVFATLPHGRTMHNLELGGFLMWMRIPDGVFIDGRTYWLYDDEDFDELVVRPVQGASELEHVADDWGIVYGFCSYRAALCSAMGASPLWLPIYYGDDSALFVRQRHLDRLAGSTLRPSHELRWVDDPTWMRGWYSAVLGDPHGRVALRAAFDESARANPDSRALVEIAAAIRSLDPSFLLQAPADRAPRP